MKLKTILESILKEEAETVSFPGDNFTALFDDTQKKIILSPIEDGSSSKTRTFIQLLKQDFRVYSVTTREDEIFEIRMDPSEDFNMIKDYIKQKAEQM